jgi:penicillin-binding protein 2
VIEPTTERRPPISPQLALRVAFLGGLALILFAIVFFRLWYLQVLSGEQYVEQANNNRVRDERIQAPRGDVVDRDGQPLVSSRPATAVQIRYGDLPRAEAARQAMYRRLGRVLAISPARIEARVNKQHKLLPYADVTVKKDAGNAVRDYLKEHQNEFGAVHTPTVFLREYPMHDLAAQLVGTVGEIGPGQLRLPQFRGVGQGTVIGKGGIEWSYDRYLRGRDGAERLQVYANGTLKGELSSTPPVAGN